MVRVLNFVLAISGLPSIYAQDGGQSGTSQTPTSTSTASTSTSSTSAVQSVDVGDGGFTFDPDTLSVSPGSKVEFHFYPGNHSVVQAAFSNPCQPLSQSSFFSGFIPDTSEESPEVFTLTVNDTNPIWYYCGQIGHCQAGMVGVINPSKTEQRLHHKQRHHPNDIFDWHPYQHWFLKHQCDKQLDFKFQSQPLPDK
ncbi:hypothetical protein Asppvi_005353 [Aspergillus pseudoviridinutans]|uniref:Cupredoxin n=1 Tax=Aspergillus pseudoviridinutans TaxID=1517512 RepID=A0A9P3BAP4_9EURO|nr:uncharacterized protein Asppvi_005353 [Aspergillus pseudoviridinutans]GIJ86464.1 hypothetical protein Asppvi_005353 [Aspergillus pseudoviridinutans]